MPRVTPYSSLLFPYGALLLVLALASLMFGADTPVMSYLFSGLILLIAGVGLLSSRLKATPPGALVVLAMLVGWMVFDSVSGRISRAGGDYAVLFAACGVFAIGFAAGRKNGRIKPFWYAMMAVFLGIALWAFADFVVNPAAIHGQPRPYHVDRLSAAFLSANTAATFFGIAVLVAAASILRALTKVGPFDFFPLMEGLFRHALLPLMTFLFAAVCLLLTASRAGLVFAVLCLVVLILWEVLSRRPAAERAQGQQAKFIRGLSIGALVLVIAGAGFWVLSGDVAGARYAELDEGANMRQVMFTAYWQQVQAHPLFGHGFNTFELVNNRAMTGENAHILSTQGAAHNAALQWLLQTGWAGLLMMWGVLASIMMKLWGGIKRRRRYRTYLRAVLVISLFVGLHSMVDYGIEIPGLMWWWALLLGFACGIATGQRGSAASGRAASGSAASGRATSGSNVRARARHP